MKIQGNAMHLHVVMAFACYVMAHCVQKDILQKLNPMLPAVAPADTEEE